MDLNETITVDSGTLYYGTPAAVEKLKQRAIPVAFPQTSIDFVRVAEVGDEFRTYGPVGGDNTSYRAIEWAYQNVEAFGLQIDRFGDETYPVLLLSSHRALKALMTYMNAAVVSA